MQLLFFILLTSFGYLPTAQETSEPGKDEGATALKEVTVPLQNRNLENGKLKLPATCLTLTKINNQLNFHYETDDRCYRHCGNYTALLLRKCIL